MSGGAGRRDLTERLMACLERDARRIAVAFGLRYRTLEPERPQVRRRLGVCYADGTIRIRLFHARTGRPLKYSSLIDTLCHELAHLRHFNHGRRFQALYRRILEHARRERIYRPGALGASPFPEVQASAIQVSAIEASGMGDEVRVRLAPASSLGSSLGGRAVSIGPRPPPEQLALF